MTGDIRMTVSWASLVLVGAGTMAMWPGRSTADSLDQVAAPKLKWAKCFGGRDFDRPNSVRQTSDDGYVMAGVALSTDGDVTGNHGTYDLWIVKTDKNGKKQWSKCLGGTGDDGANCIRQTSDGGYIVTGYTDSNDGDVSGNHGDYDAWVVKTAGDGSIEWQRCLGGTATESGYSIRQTADGGYILGGASSSTDGDVKGNHGGFDMWIVKLRANGSIQWKKCIGGTEDDAAYDILSTSDGGFLAAGVTRSTNGDIRGNHGGEDYLVVKLAKSAKLQWLKCYGGTKDDEAWGSIQTAGGGYVLTGSAYSDDGDILGHHGSVDMNDGWVLEISGKGAIVRQRCLGGSDFDATLSIQPDADGGYTLAGYASSRDGDVKGLHGDIDVWAVKLDASLALQWQKCMGGTWREWASLSVPTSDGGIVLAGPTTSRNGDVKGNHGDFDYWLVKLGK